MILHFNRLTGEGKRDYCAVSLKERASGDTGAIQWKPKYKSPISACHPGVGLFHALIFSLLSQRGYPTSYHVEKRHSLLAVRQERSTCSRETAVLPVAAKNGRLVGGLYAVARINKFGKHFPILTHFREGRGSIA